MKKVGNLFLTETNGGLEIFKKYLQHEFTIDNAVVVDNLRFTITWNIRYENYAIYVDIHNGVKWENTNRYNAIWFVKEKFGLTENEVYQKLNREMNLNIDINENI